MCRMESWYERIEGSLLQYFCLLKNEMFSFNVCGMLNYTQGKKTIFYVS